MAKVVDIADEIYRDSSQDSIHSIPSIAAWLRFSGNLGNLNTLIHTDYIINSTTLEIVSESSAAEIGNEEVGIYKLLYMEKYFERKVNTSLGAADADIISEASSDGGTLRFVSRSERSKVFNQLKKDIREQLNKNINYYLYNKATPLAVDGDDTSVISSSSRYAPNSIDGSNFIDNAR